MPDYEWITNLSKEKAGQAKHLLPPGYAIDSPQPTVDHAQIDLIKMGAVGLYRDKRFPVATGEEMAAFWASASSQKPIPYRFAWTKKG